MKNLKNTILICISFISFGWSQPTFYKDISPIIYNNCAVCHRSGEIAPMSFTNYEEVKNWANTIKYVTSIRYMPPWKADPDYSEFLGETYLSEHDIQLIADWVDGGAPEGNKNEEAVFPEFPEDSALGEPDLVLSFKKSHLHKGNNEDEYRWFVLPTGLTEDKIIKAVEMRPGNRKIVHHALFFQDDSGIAREMDARTPEYGYQGFGSFAGDTRDESILDQKQFPAYAPGQKARLYPDGLGQVLTAGADLVVQLHYAPWPVDETDSSSVNIFFADETEETVDRFVDHHIMVPLPGVVVNRTFFLLPEEVFTFHGIWTVPEDLSLMGIAPHMHLLGQDWTVYLDRPDGTREQLISIPEWDFNWQGSYYFPKFIHAPRGSKIHAYATYDNTSENPNNPNNPPKFTTWGEGTEDEMYYLPILFVPYQEGDENINFGSTTSTEDFEEIAGNVTSILPIYPNPVSDLVYAEFNLSSGQILNMDIINANGQTIRSLRQSEFFKAGQHAINFRTNELESGIYFLRLTTQSSQVTQKFVKP